MDLTRYSRQIRVAGIGEEGLTAARAATAGASPVTAVLEPRLLLRLVRRLAVQDPSVVGLREEALAGENWLGFKVLQNGGLLPEWLMLAKEIEADRLHLLALDARHAEAVELAASSGAWDAHAPSIERCREAFESAAIALRRKQDRFNQDAPSVQLERPGIWIEHHLARLDARVAEARGDASTSL